MLKRKAAILTAIIFIINLFPVFLTQNAFAYQNSSYFNNLKVGLVSMSSTSMKLTLNGDYTINGQTYPLGTIVNLSINGTSISMNGSAVSQISLTPVSNTNLLSITAGTITNKYMGSFLIKVYNGIILPINIIDMESYLKGVVGYEMSDSFPLEALKTQAVAARNYALSRIGWEAAKGYDFDDTTNYQVYKGFNSSYTNVINAVEQTRGQVLLYNDALVETLYSAWHGGVSENSENVWGNYVAYLRSVTDPFESDPWPNGNRVLTNSQIQSTLITKGYLGQTDTFVKLDLNSITKFASGRVSNINIIYKNSLGSTLTKSVTKDSTRTFLSLPSNLYTVTYDTTGGAYTFTGKGNGHGLGMSQIGAKNRAAAGQTYDLILKFYYQNVYLQNLILKASISNLTQSASTLFAGNTISFNTAASGGNGYGYLYKYVVKNSGNITFTRDFSSSPALDFTPSAPGNYTVESYVKDTYSISDYDDMKTSSFTVYSVPVFNSFTINKANTLVGQNVTGTASVQGGSGSYLYKFQISKDGNILASTDYLTASQYSYVPSQPGAYTMAVYMKDSTSSNAYDLKQSQNFTAYDTLSAASLGKDVQNIFAGDTVNFSTSISGGSGKGITYKYIVSKDGQILNTRDFSTDNTFTYIPSIPGSYEADVYALDAISDNSYDSQGKINFTVGQRASIASLYTEKSINFTNDNMAINTTLNNSNSNDLFKYTIMKDGTAVLSRDYTSCASIQFTPIAAGNYTVSVFAKDPLSLRDYDDTKSLSYTIYDYPVLTSAASDKTKLFKNDTIKFTAAGSKGTGNYLYRFVIAKDGDTVMTQNYSSNSSLSYVPILEGNYNTSVYIKDSSSQKDYDDVNKISFTVLPDAKISSVQSNKPQYLSGQTINLNVAAVSGSGSYLYKHVISKDGVNVSTIDYNSLGSLFFKTDGSGTYTMTEYMKDVLSSKDYDDMQTLSIPVYSPPSINMTATQNAVIAGSTAGYNITENGGSGKAQYRFVVTQGSNTLADSGYLDTNSFSFTPSAAGSYQITGCLKDALSENTFDAQSILNLTAYAPQITSASANGCFFEGKPVTFNAAGTGASPSGLSYRYDILNNGTLVTSNSYSSSGTFTFTTPAAVTYTVKVYGKDGLSTNSYDTVKQFNITINTKPLYLSTLPLSFGMTSNDVISLQNALIKLGYAVSSATGYFGSQTKSAVITFQTSRGLTADGIVGNMTYQALNDALIEKSGIKNLGF